MGKKTSKTSSTSKPPKWAVPALKDAVGNVGEVVNGNQGNLDAQAGQIRGFLPGLGQQAFGPNPGLDAANQYAQDSIGGKYLDADNPYMQRQIDQTAGDVSNRVNSMFARSGASLGTAHAGVLSKELANAENSMRYGNYAQERQNQQGAAGMMPSLNASQYAGVMPYLAAQQTAGQLPYSGIQNYGVLGNILGGYGTQSGTQPGGWGQQVLGAGLAAASMFSDRRLKTNITLLRRDPDGLGWYSYAMKNNPNLMLEGVMSDEVKALRPHAHIPNYQGTPFDGVNYAKLSEAA